MTTSPGLFIYYRVAASALVAADAAVAALQAQLRERCAGLTAECLRRPEVVDGLVTLMEVYRPAAGGEDAAPALGEVAEQMRVLLAARTPWWLGARHVETFVPLSPPCA